MASIYIERPIHNKSIAPMRGFLSKLDHEFGQSIQLRSTESLHVTLASICAAIELDELAKITKNRPPSAEETRSMLVRDVRRVGQTALYSSLALELYDSVHANRDTLFDESHYHTQHFNTYNPAVPFLPHITIGRVRSNDLTLLQTIQDWSTTHAPSEITLASVRTRFNTMSDSTSQETKTAS